MKKLKSYLLVVGAVVCAAFLVAAVPSEKKVVTVKRLASQEQTVEIWRNGKYHPVQVEVMRKKVTDENGNSVEVHEVKDPEKVEEQLPPIDPAQTQPPPPSELRAQLPLPPGPIPVNG